MSPYKPMSRRGGRSSSFNSEINNSSMPFSSIAMSRSSFQRNNKKTKFAFLNKLKLGKEKKKHDRLNIEDIIIEEDNEKPLEQSKMKNLLKNSVYIKVPDPDNQLSEIFDNRASNPIHVNNVKFEGFQIDQTSKFGTHSPNQE